MSKVDRCSFRLYQTDISGFDYVVGSGFTVRDGKKSLLVTAAHVAFESSNQARILKAKQYVGDTSFVDLSFQRYGYKDVAFAEIGPIEDTLDLGISDTIVNGNSLKIRPVYARLNRSEFTLNIVEIGGIPITRRGNRPLDPHYDTNFEYVSQDGTQPAWPGCSGSPIVDSEEKVVGVHTAGCWEIGHRRNFAVIFTVDHPLSKSI